MSSKGNAQKKPNIHHHKDKKSTHASSIRSIITKDQELRELNSCRSRIVNELKLFSKLNKPEALKALESKLEPKIVKLDTEFASKSRTNKNSTAADIQNTPVSLDNMTADTLRAFNQLPISTRTKKALADAGYKTCTRIQHASLSSTLALKDLYAISCTGSGKSLAFIIPILEQLWKSHWTPELGLGALIIEPTRELALQTFHALHRIGKYHPFSAGLLVGGNSYEEERKLIAEMNILVCTPGRLIHHIEKSYGLSFDNLVALVIDEADHLLDTGFADQFEQIQPLFPKDKSLHMMLFSATSNKQVEKLAKKVLSPDFHFISLSQQGTPANLYHRYIVTPEVDKIRVLFEFLRLHKSNKIVVFAATTREVTYLYELFKALNIQAPLHRLHSKLSHGSRMNEYYQYQQEKFGVVVCTDVAARGLDFTGVSWVVHFDCPTSIPQYIHRAGRTARLKGTGTNLLLLTPSQQQFVDMLRIQNDLDIKQAGLPPFKSDFFSKLQAHYSEHPVLKAVAEKAVISYMQHLIHQHNTFSTLFSALSNAGEGEQWKTFITEFSLESADKQTQLQVKDVNSKLYNGLLAHIFNIESMDMIGYCRAFGLHSVPVLVNEDDQEALEAEQAALEAQLEQKRAEKAQKVKSAQKSTTQGQDDDDLDASLAVLRKTNHELDEFSNRIMVLQIAEKRIQDSISANKAQNSTQQRKQQIQQDTALASFNDLFKPTQQQPSPPQSAKSTSILISNDTNGMDFICLPLDPDDSTNTPETAEISNLFSQLKQRYRERDVEDKKHSAERAQQKRHHKQNLILLERFAKLGYKMSLEELQDMLKRRKEGHKVDLEQFKQGLDGEDDDFGGDDEENRQTAQDAMDAFAFDGDMSDDDEFLSNNPNKVVQLGKPGQSTLFDDSDHSNDEVVKFGLAGDHSDDFDSNDDEDYSKPQLPPQGGKTIQARQFSTMTLDETSEDDSDDDVSKFAQKAKITQPKAKAQPQPVSKHPAPKQTAAKAFSLEESSDDSDMSDADKDIFSNKKVVTTQPKRFLNLDKSSDDDSEDETPIQAVKKAAVGKGRKVVTKK